MIKKGMNQISVHALFFLVPWEGRASEPIVSPGHSVPQPRLLV